MTDDTAIGSKRFDEYERRVLAEQGAVKAFPKNTIIVSEGDQTDSFYIILSGRVKIFVGDEEGREIVLATQGAGDYFGEMVLDGGPRSASVMTLEPSRFAIIGRAHFREFLHSHPAFSIRLVGS